MRKLPRAVLLSFACTALFGTACGGGQSQAKQDEETMTTEQPSDPADAPDAPATTETPAEEPAEAAPPAETGPDFADPNIEPQVFFDTFYKVTGQVDPEQVRGVIGRNKDSIYECYKKELPNNPGLSGRVLMGITATGDGKVASAVVKKSTLGNKTLESCMTNAIRGWKMPASKDGGLVMVQYPFVLPP